MANLQIKAICFDLDGVYFTSAGFKSFKQKIMDMGVSKDDVDFILHGGPMDRFKRGKVGEDVFWREAIEYWELPTVFDDVVRLLPLGYEVNAEVDQLVREVRARGYQTCICSNNFATRVNALEERFGFLEKFDVHVFSYEVGVLKPDKGIFEALIEAAKCRPEEIIYSDDNESKLAGARMLGITCFLYVDFNSFMQQLRKLGIVG